MTAATSSSGGPSVGHVPETDSARVVLDLRELEFLDSSGLRTLLLARRRADNAGAQFSLVAVAQSPWFAVPTAPGSRGKGWSRARTFAYRPECTQRFGRA